MEFSGEIVFQKELTVTQLRKLNFVIEKRGLFVLDDGKSMRWDGSIDPEKAVHDAVRLLSEWGFICVGVIKSGEKQIVALRNRVKILEGGHVRSL